MDHSESQSRLQSLLHPNKGKATVQVQLEGASSQTAPYLRFCCIIEDENLVFPVDIRAQADVVDLKKAIHSERAHSILQGIDPHILELWKFRDINPIDVKPVDTLPERIKSMRASLERLDPMDSLSDSFPSQPSKKQIHIVVKLPVM